MAIATITFGSQEAQSNDTTDTTVVAAPAASTQRLISSIKVHNTDTAVATVTIKKAKAASEWPVHTETALAVNGNFEVRDLVLDATDETIEIVLSGAVSTNQLNVVSTYADKA